MTGCTEIELLISLALDQALTEDEANTVAEHLQTCEACRSLQADLAVLRQDMTAMCAEPPADLIHRTLGRMAAEGTVAPAGKRPKRFYRNWLATAAVFVLVVTAAVFGGNLIPLTPDSIGQDASVDRGQHPGSHARSAIGNDFLQEGESALQEAAPPPSPEPSMAAANENDNQADKTGTEPASGTESVSPDEPAETTGNPPQSQGRTTFGMEDGARQDLSEEAASELLLGYLNQQPAEAALSALTYTGLNANGSCFLFLAVYEDEVTAYYEVNRSDHTITQVPDPDAQASSPES